MWWLPRGRELTHADILEEKRLLPVFKAILERIMEGHTTAEDYLFLKEHNERVDQAGGFAESLDVKVLCARLEDKDNLNRDMLLKISEASGEPIVRIEAENTGTTYARVATASEVSNLAPVLYLAKGARVMCTWNGWKVAGLVNGAQGIVHEILYAEGQGPPSMPIAVLVQFPTLAEGGIYRGPSYLAEVPGVVKFTPNRESFYDDSEKKIGEKLGTPCTRTQFPLDLAYATTIQFLA